MLVLVHSALTQKARLSSRDQAGCYSAASPTAWELWDPRRHGECQKYLTLFDTKTVLDMFWHVLTRGIVISFEFWHFLTRFDYTFWHYLTLSDNTFWHSPKTWGFLTFHAFWTLFDTFESFLIRFVLVCKVLDNFLRPRVGPETDVGMLFGTFWHVLIRFDTFWHSLTRKPLCFWPFLFFDTFRHAGVANHFLTHAFFDTFRHKLAYLSQTGAGVKK